MLLVVFNVVCKEECAGLDAALSFTYYWERNPYPGSTSTVRTGSTATMYIAQPDPAPISCSAEGAAQRTLLQLELDLEFQTETETSLLSV